MAVSDIGVGDRVVCVAAFGSPPGPGEVYPVVGGIYTVRGFDEDGTAYIYLEEIINPPFLDHPVDPGECTFDLNCFRKCRPTNIEIFRKIAANPELDLVEA